MLELDGELLLLLLKLRRERVNHTLVATFVQIGHPFLLQGVNVAEPQLTSLTVDATSVGLVSLRKTCEMLGISRTTLWAIIKRGELAVVRVGPRRVFVRDDELRAYLERNTRRAE